MSVAKIMLNTFFMPGTSIVVIIVINANSANSSSIVTATIPRAAVTGGRSHTNSSAIYASESCKTPFCLRTVRT